MRTIMTTKWSEFQESLGKILNMTIYLLNSEGQLLNIYNAFLPPFTNPTSYPELIKKYEEFFKTIPQLCETFSCRIFKDPLGLGVAVTPITKDIILLLGGFLISDNNCTEGLHGYSQQYELKIHKDKRLKVFCTDGNEIHDKIENVSTLYKQLIYSNSDKHDHGQNIMLLVTMEEINKLMLNLLNPEHFDFQQVLDLAASSLVILFDAEGACIFTHQYDGKTVTVYRGPCCEYLHELRINWMQAIEQKKDPIETMSLICDNKKAIRYGHNIETLSYSQDNLIAFVAIVNPKEKNLTRGLSLIVRQIAVILEMSAVYEAFRKRSGIIINSIKQGIVSVNCKGELMVVSKAASNILKGTKMSFVIGKSLEECSFPMSMKVALNDAIVNGESYAHKLEKIEANNNETLYLQWSVTPLLDDDGKTLGAILMYEDVTELINLRNQAQDRERLAVAGEVAAGLAHEIRNPLGVAMGTLQLFEMLDDQQKQGEMLKVLRNELIRMNEILTNFLNIAKPSSKQDNENISLSNIIEELSVFIKSETLLNDIDFVIQDYPKELPLVIGNKNSLRQVFLNIAKNAIEAMEKGGKLSVFYDCKDNYVSVSFTDTGTGIPKEHLQNIFRPFFTTKVAGTGLGLPISYSIVKEMGGELKVESKVGHGTTVKVSLPYSLT
ncbi:MAG: ATP-binding protein [Bacillota bacterium]